ncbi:hypothetical protein [Cupriavidus pauculus]|nr:hypothetical protein [Cupriavidus pauculus]
MKRFLSILVVLCLAAKPLPADAAAMPTPVVRVVRRQVCTA